MRLVSLGANFVTQRDVMTQNAAGSHMYGSQPSGEGSRTTAVAKIEANSGETAIRGGHARKHPTLTQLKRFLIASGGNPRGVRGLLGVD